MMQDSPRKNVHFVAQFVVSRAFIKVIKYKALLFKL